MGVGAVFDKKKSTMLSMVLAEKGKLVYEQRPLPTVHTGEVLVRVVYAGICGSDIHALHGLQPSLSFPCVMGHELVGIVMEIHGTSDCKVGDRVVIDPSYRCKECVQCVSGKENICENLRVLGVHCDGGFAEYCVCAIDMIHRIPEDMEDDIALFCEPMSIAVHAASRMQTKKRDSAAIIGAGPIGLAILCYIRSLFNTVIVCDVLPNRREAAKNIGADIVFDQPDSVELPLVDVVFDAVSIPATARLSTQLVARGGDIVIVGLANENTAIALLPILKKELNVVGTRMTRKEDFFSALEFLRTIDAKAIRTILTNVYPLSNAAAGIQFVEQHPEASIKVYVDCQGGHV